MTEEEIKEHLREMCEDEVFKGRKYKKYGYFSHEFRQYIYGESNYECFYCELPLEKMGFENPPQIDHIEPKSLGGTNDEWNLTLACRHCNASKGNRDFFNYIKNPTMCLDKPIFNEEGLIINF